MQGILLRVWRHRRYRITHPLDSRADTVDSPWCPSPMPARVPVSSAQTLEHRDGLRQDHRACHNRPRVSRCPREPLPCDLSYQTDKTGYRASELWGLVPWVVVE